MTLVGLNRVADSNDADLEIRICDLNGSPVTTLLARFSGMLELNLSYEEFDDIINADHNHPILWLHVEPHAVLYFYSAASVPLHVVGRLYEAHERMVQGWYPLDRFMNDLTPLHKLLAGSNGRLAAGPLSLIRAYEAVLHEEAIECSVLERGVAKTSGRTPPKPVALLMGVSHVVAQARYPLSGEYGLSM